MSEHLDIGMQLKARGLRLVVEPSSRIVFDNPGTQTNLSNLTYFNLRWNKGITEQSSRLFGNCWVYQFYPELLIYNWGSRRRILLVLRWLYLPIIVVNKVDRVLFGLKRRLIPIWDPLDDLHKNAKLLYGHLPDGIPQRFSHSVVL